LTSPVGDEPGRYVVQRDAMACVLSQGLNQRCVWGFPNHSEMRRGELYIHFHTSPHLTLGKRGLGTSRTCRFPYSQRGAGANPTKIYTGPATENNEIQVACPSRNTITG
jgi:hypothetical protein